MPTPFVRYWAATTLLILGCSRHQAPAPDAAPTNPAVPPAVQAALALMPRHAPVHLRIAPASWPKVRATVREALQSAGASDAGMKAVLEAKTAEELLAALANQAQRPELATQIDPTGSWWLSLWAPETHGQPTSAITGSPIEPSEASRFFHVLLLPSRDPSTLKATLVDTFRAMQPGFEKLAHVEAHQGWVRLIWLAADVSRVGDGNDPSLLFGGLSERRTPALHTLLLGDDFLAAYLSFDEFAVHAVRRNVAELHAAMSTAPVDMRAQFAFVGSAMVAQTWTMFDPLSSELEDLVWTLDGDGVGGVTTQLATTLTAYGRDVWAGHDAITLPAFAAGEVVADVRGGVDLRKLMGEARIPRWMPPSEQGFRPESLAGPLQAGAWGYAGMVLSRAGLLRWALEASHATQTREVGALMAGFPIEPEAVRAFALRVWRHPPSTPPTPGQPSLPVRAAAQVLLSKPTDSKATMTVPGLLVMLTKLKTEMPFPFEFELTEHARGTLLRMAVNSPLRESFDETEEITIDGLEVSIASAQLEKVAADADQMGMGPGPSQLMRQLAARGDVRVRTAVTTAGTQKLTLDLGYTESSHTPVPAAEYRPKEGDADACHYAMGSQGARLMDGMGTAPPDQKGQLLERSARLYDDAEACARGDSDLLAEIRFGRAGWSGAQGDIALHALDIDAARSAYALACEGGRKSRCETSSMLGKVRGPLRVPKGAAAAPELQCNRVAPEIWMTEGSVVVDQTLLVARDDQMHSALAPFFNSLAERATKPAAIGPEAVAQRGLLALLGAMSGEVRVSLAADGHLRAADVADLTDALRESGASHLSVLVSADEIRCVSAQLQQSEPTGQLFIGPEGVGAGTECSKCGPMDTVVERLNIGAGDIYEVRAAGEMQWGDVTRAMSVISGAGATVVWSGVAQ